MTTAQNSAITSIIARCLLDADFHRRLVTDAPAALQKYPLTDSVRVEFHAFDLLRLESFGGFLTAVLHNHLFESFPFTRELLRRYGIELDLFTAYRRQLGDATTAGLKKEEKSVRFFTFLESKVASAKRYRLPGLIDVLTHERFESEIYATLDSRDDTSDCASFEPVSARDQDRCRPRLPATLRFGYFRYDPLKAIEALRMNVFDAESLKRYNRYRVYSADRSDAMLRIAEAPRIACSLLSEVNGRRTLAAILRNLERKSGVRRARLRQVVATCVQNGLIILSSPREDLGRG